ncbi:peptidoglycan recognition protein-like [Zophobas morio]|uniref:peptidoglycan recognition protein-like n=1 Tax=Zophobas morio TaxID=2755281 RepID=UPI003082A9EA
MAKTVISSSSDENSDIGIQFEARNCGSERSETPKMQHNSKDFRILDYLRRNLAIVSVCALSIVTVLLIVTIIILLQKNFVPVAVKPVEPSPITPIENLTLPHELKIVSRLEWLAQPPIEPATPLHTPVPYVIIHHTATENCSSQTQCVFHVRDIQMYHIESRGWWDIGYNFLVGGDGKAYEGRGWKSEGAHTFRYNVRSIGIAFIGNFNTYKPPQRQIAACKHLIAKGVEMGYIEKDYILLGARQLHTTRSPGDKLYEEMKKWDHWARGP